MRKYELTGGELDGARVLRPDIFIVCRAEGDDATRKLMLAGANRAAAGIRALEVARANGAWQILDGPEAGIEPPELTAALDAVPGARANWDMDYARQVIATIAAAPQFVLR